MNIAKPQHRACGTGRADRRRAFTLIELLLVVSIIAVLSSLAVGLLISAREDASAARTRSIIARCHSILMSRLENYEARTVPYRYDDIGVTTVEDKRRCYNSTIAEWLLVEMPSQLSDFDGSNTFPRLLYAANPQYIDALNSRRTAMHEANLNYLSRYGAAAFNDQGTLPVRTDKQSAKLLYMILSNTWDGDNRGTHFLQPSETKIDNNVPYVVDAFGDELTFQIVHRPNGTGAALPVSNISDTFSLEDVEIIITSKNLN